MSEKYRHVETIEELAIDANGAAAQRRSRQGTEKRSFPGVRLTERLTPLDGIGHIGYRKRQMRKPLGRAWLEAEICVPAL